MSGENPDVAVPRVGPGWHVCFALNGALTAIREVKLDVVGVVTLGMITALGGGIIRDILLGSLPGVVGVLRNGDGPTVLLRADMDALPVREEMHLAYASEATVVDGGVVVPVMHACGHDVYVSCLLGAVALMAGAQDHWSGTVVAVFQPSEETADGAKAMLEQGLASIVGRVDVAMGQHVLPMAAGQVGTRSGPTLAAADSMRVIVYGRGAHGSMPQAAVDPVVMAAMIVVRLQTVVSREVTPGEAAVLTIGSIAAGSKSNVIPDHAVLQLNIRTYSEATRSAILDAIDRIVRAEFHASRSPREPEIELFDRYPLTDNDVEVTRRVSSAFSNFFGDRATQLPARAPAKISVTSPRHWVCRITTGVSAASTSTCTGPHLRPAESPRTSP